MDCWNRSIYCSREVFSQHFISETTFLATIFWSCTEKNDEWDEECQEGPEETVDEVETRPAADDRTNSLQTHQTKQS